MRLNTKLGQQLLIALSLLALQACGIEVKKMLTSDREDGTPHASPYGLPKAMIQAQSLALNAPPVTAGLKPFANCEALKADIEKSLTAQWIQAKADIAMQIQQQLEWQENPNRWGGKASTESIANQSTGSAVPDAAPTTAASDDGKTNVQEKGVDEADSVRVGLDQIFAISFDAIQVIDRANLKVQGVMNLENAANAQLFTSGHKLIVLEKRFKPLPSEAGGKAVPIPVYDGVPSPAGMGEESLRVTTYETAVGAMPRRIRTLELKGRYIDSRLIGNQLILVLNDSIPMVSASLNWSEFSEEAWYGKPAAKAIFDSIASYQKRQTSIAIVGDKVADVPCTSIIQRKVLDFDYSLAKTLSLNIDDAAAETKAIASIGQGDEIYVSADSIYLLKAKVSWLQSRYYTSYAWTGSADEKLFIRQIRLNAQTGELAAAGEGQVKGHIKDRWALHATQAGQNLIVTTSSGNLYDHQGPNIAQNHLFVLELNAETKNLDIRAKIADFGTYEDIRAVRYVGDKVYVVTFKKTDPLFAFDLSNLDEPKILSGLKIPGFSTYMHPLADGRMLGVGFDALDQGDFAYYQGIQVSLFDVSNPLAMARLDNHIYGSRGSNSEVTSNPHAFFYDEASKLIALPLVQLEGNPLEGQATNRSFSGALLMSFEDDALVEAGRISHADWIPQQCLESMNSVQWWSDPSQSMDVRRIYRVDNRLLTISSFGLKAYGLSDFETPLVATMFAKAKSSPCQLVYTGWY